MLALVEHFYGKPVTQDVIVEYCNLNHIEAVPLTTYEDFKFQYEHDKRMENLVPAILNAILAYKPLPELIDEAARNTIIKNNEQISMEVCRLMEEYGVLYQEVDIVCEGLKGVVSSILTDASQRASNAGARVLMNLAIEKFGTPLTLKTLGEAERKIKLPEKAVS